MYRFFTCRWYVNIGGMVFSCVFFIVLEFKVNLGTTGVTASGFFAYLPEAFITSTFALI